MKTCSKLLMVFVVLCLLCTPALAQEKKGPIVDKIYVNVKMQEEIGIKDVAEGLSDIFFYGTDGPVIMGLDQATRDKLDMYIVPAGSWSLLFNPIPNQAPYLVNVEGKDHFNPFAIREVRFAMNFLINRKYIVDEILLGTGNPAFTMATAGQPGTYKYNLLANKMGFTDEGDEQKAIADITAALQQAAELPELKGKLAKTGEWWTFNNEPITLKFLIRVDDPQGRVKKGEYVAQQIEKAGLKVDRLMWDRAKCSAAVYQGDPAKYEWHLYTEGWGAGATRAFWEHIVAQMYAPWYGYMPGANKEGFWNYAHPELDDLTRKAYTGNFLTEDEYWDLALKGLEIGLHEAVRIYVANQSDYYTANKARFKNRMLYGLGDGLNDWSLISANTQDGVLRVTGFSAKGALFMYPWDPIGTEGFRDVYSLVCAKPTGLPSMSESPATAINTAVLAVPQDVQTQVARNDAGDVVGQIAVPADAILYDSMQKAWVNVGEGVTAMTKSTYRFNFGKYHHGQPVAVKDLLYAYAFRKEWATKDGDDDRYHDAPYESSHAPGLKTLKGWVIHPDQTITTYYDYNFPASQPRTASWGAPALTVLSGKPNIVAPWEILEAISQMVVEGNASNTGYSFASGQGTPIDVLTPSCVADIKAKLVELKDKQFVPASIKDYITPEQAVASYDASLNWIDAHGHAMIGNGAFYIEKYDPASNYMELTAFRDPSYPFTPDYWPKALATTVLHVDSVDIPAMYAAQEKTMPVQISLSEVLYPENTGKPAEQGDVSAMVVTPDGEMTYPAQYKEPGKFEVMIPVETLEAGSYTILIDARLEGAMPASASATVVIY